MSTRCQVAFKRFGKDYSALIYRHSDGYPEVAGVDLHNFLDSCADLKLRSWSGSRFNDPEYLAAKYVVWLAEQFRFDQTRKHPLDFLCVGVCKEMHWDIDYLYEIVCTEGRPKVHCYEMVWDSKEGRPIQGKEIEIEIG